MAAQAKGYRLALESDPGLPASSDVALDPNVPAEALAHNQGSSAKMMT
jgi:hypothetical protein